VFRNFGVVVVIKIINDTIENMADLAAVARGGSTRYRKHAIVTSTSRPLSHTDTLVLMTIGDELVYTLNPDVPWTLIVPTAHEAITTRQDPACIYFKAVRSGTVTLRFEPVATGASKIPEPRACNLVVM
jgi:hypothetical protein